MNVAEVTILILVVVNMFETFFSSCYYSFISIFCFSSDLLVRYDISLFRASRHQLFVRNCMYAMTGVKSSKGLFIWINRVQIQCRTCKFLLGQRGLSWSQKLQSAQDLGLTNVCLLLGQLKLAGAKPEALNSRRDSQVLNASPMIQKELEKLQPQDEGPSIILFRCCICQSSKVRWLGSIYNSCFWVDYGQQLCSACWRKDLSNFCGHLGWTGRANRAARGRDQIMGFCS